jgi:hypothetical protein
MNQQGFVYALINPSLDGMVKIGKTTRSPEERAKEISSSTGVPTPFYVAYKIAVNNCHNAEKYMHILLSSGGYRVSDNREFFQIPLDQAVKLMIEVESKFTVENIDSVTSYDGGYLNDEFLDALHIDTPTEYPWEDIEELAEQYYYGDGQLQDYGEAIKLYKQAVTLGSITACIALSDMYYYGLGCRVDLSQALQWLKNGAKNGAGICYGHMAKLFIEENHQMNAEKCWEEYFKSDDFWRFNPDYDLVEMWYLSQVSEGSINHYLKDFLITIKSDICTKAKQNIDNVGSWCRDDAERKYNGLVNFFTRI